MRGLLFLAVLSVKTSYFRNMELSVEDANDVPDTLQWWFGTGRTIAGQNMRQIRVAGVDRIDRW